MLTDAARRAAPKKYTQKRCHGMYAGTICDMPWATAKCSAPKTASGMAKKRLARAITFSIPRAWEKSFLTASSAISKSTMAAAQVEIAVRERSKKRNADRLAGTAGCIFTPVRRDAYEIGAAGRIVRYRSLGENGK